MEGFSSRPLATPVKPSVNLSMSCAQLLRFLRGLLWFFCYRRSRSGPIEGIFKPAIGWAFVQLSMFNVGRSMSSRSSVPSVSSCENSSFEQEQTEGANWRDFQAAHWPCIHGGGFAAVPCASLATASPCLVLCSWFRRCPLGYGATGLRRAWGGRSGFFRLSSNKAQGTRNKARGAGATLEL